HTGTSDLSLISYTTLFRSPVLPGFSRVQGCARQGPPTARRLRGAGRGLPENGPPRLGSHRGGPRASPIGVARPPVSLGQPLVDRSEERTSELPSPRKLDCR